MSFKRDDQIWEHCRVCKSWPRHSTLHNSGVMYRLSQICMSPYSRASKQVQGRNHQARNQKGTKPIGAHPLLSKGCTWGLCSRSVIHLGACKDHRMHPSHFVVWSVQRVHAYSNHFGSANWLVIVCALVCSFSNLLCLLSSIKICLVSKQSNSDLAHLWCGNMLCVHLQM